MKEKLQRGVLIEQGHVNVMAMDHVEHVAGTPGEETPAELVSRKPGLVDQCYCQPSFGRRYRSRGSGRARAHHQNVKSAFAH